MVINLNLLVTIVGCSAIVVFYLMHLRSGLRGFVYALVGCAVVVCGYFYAQRMFELLGVVAAAVLICSILALITAVSHASRRKAHYYVPLEKRGKSGKVTTRRRVA